jgi:hypothetical protein
MSYWIKHITNKLIFFNKLSDRYETAKFLSLVFLILISGIFIHLTTNMTGLFCGIGILFIVSCWAIFRMLVYRKEIKTDFSIYDIPQEGDIITFIKDKTFNSFSQPITKTSISSSAVYIKIKVFIQKGDKYKVTNVIRTIDDVSLKIVSLSDESDDCAISFIETRNYWKTKSDLRNNKIEQILN